MKRKIPASEPNAQAPARASPRLGPPDRATKSARTVRRPRAPTANDEDEDDVVVRIPSADDRDPVRREALARALARRILR